MIEIKTVSLEDLEWFIETAAVRMLSEELKRPELIHLTNLYQLGAITIRDGTGFIAYRDGEPVGAIAGILVPNLYNPDFKTLAELFWWVSPEERQSRAGLMLLNAFDRRGTEIADDITLSLLSSSKINTKSLEKKGFLLGELAFVKSIRGK